ncbi:photosynthetic complex putative assembly protein PuhB [Brevundimonas subvibrioides]|uniref:Photosynthetic complex assembly protein PuhB, putative n=1 Tax=Brevundimonas subvibrioides (strain ATCC 15264 / DSM 4735 / LMG 14903 / NBRC 16000 / CB 81) TaxID=633149 RepID=D9QPB4_BRESC|nr:photosynthetic complex putative assembly protein PuhB [Brevundimonas subvibrioides]ADL02377.1 photosynthetic complex assembly protein PuhB, putative [Brevundimonas subvibrioides ATCC 15264]
MSELGPNEHAGEPVRGLPGHLPAGEHILWQGAPDWRTLARTALHTHLVGGYFGILAAWNTGSGLASGVPVAQAMGSGVVTLLAGALAIALLTLYAWLAARTTVYTMTNRRFVLRHGVALSKCFNIPYSAVASAGLKLDARGVGDIPLGLAGDAKIAYPHLWPHVRPWSFVNPQPMMRALPDAAAVAERLSLHLQQASSAADRPFVVEPVRQPAARPSAVSSGTGASGGQPAAA